MKKLRLTVIILSFLLIFIACKKSNDSIELSPEDSLATKNDTINIQNEPLTTIEESEYQQAINRLNTRATDLSEAVLSKPGTSDVSAINYDLGDIDGNVYEDGVAEFESMEISKSATSADMSAMAKRRSMRASRVSKNISSSSDNLGFSVGGAKDIGNFRENIKNNFMPSEEDITHEGIFYDYFFDNNITKDATHLFEPAYTSSKTKHPLTNKEELYLSVGLNSNLSASSFKRKKLNLTIVLDISGSMNEGFDRYHYDRNSGDYIDWDKRSKIEIAKECMIDLTKHLNKDDRFAVVLFNWESHLAKPFNLLNKTNMSAIRSHIENINAEGSTNMYAGFSTASELYENLPNYDSKEYDNRIIFLTDAMPNKGITDKNSIWGLMKVNAEKKVYTTFMGVGIDLNSELINYITKTPGANYFSIHSAKDFKKRMDTQFDFMVTPLIFDLTLHLQSNKYDIEAIYGAPEANQATGEIMKINTLFPSESSDGKTRGGIILIKLKKSGKGSDDIKLTCSYKDRNGIPDLISENIEFSKSLRGSDNGIRKAVLLSRYVNLMHDWINNKTIIADNNGEDDWQYNKQADKPKPRQRNNGYRGSKTLTVNSYYQEQFSKFKTYFAKEANDIKDEDLKQELDILELLLKIEKVPINKLNYNEKKDFVRKWFTTEILPQINAKFRTYSTKKSISGQLKFRLFFEDDKIVKAFVQGRGSINDEQFTQSIENIIEGHSISNIGDYQFEITQSFD